MLDIFNEFAIEDEDNSGEVAINMVGFKKMCKVYGIYSENSQNSFLEKVSQRGPAKDIDSLKSYWRAVIKAKFGVM